MRYKLTLRWLGTHYCGWQVQPNAPTICGAVQDAVERLFGERGELTGTTDRTIDLDGHNVIVLSGKTAVMQSADCPDQVCVRTGRLTRAGQVAVCLPHRVILKLTGTSTNGIDAIVS